MTTAELTKLAPSTVYRAFLRMWFRITERHYLMCAEVEAQRAREAQMNVAYYQRKAAFARSAKLEM